MSVLVDSDVLIELTRGRDQVVLKHWADLGDSNDAILCSTISIAELWHGARTHEHQLLDRLFESLLCIAVDANISKQAGDYVRKYHKSYGLQLGDALIAATATLNKARLWTRNKKHYPMPAIDFWS